MTETLLKTIARMHWAVTACARLVNAQVKCARYVQHVFLLAVRLCWGWQFFLAGRGKLSHFDRTAQFFASLDIPFPKMNALLAAGTECLGGLLLLIGLASRLISLPLCFTMIVAYATAHRSELLAALSDPDGFLEAPPFLFLMASIVVALFGPGVISADACIRRVYSRNVHDLSTTSQLDT